MKRIEGFTGRAKKLRGKGDIEYELGVDGCGEFFVRFTGNEQSGTLSQLWFSIKEYKNIRNSKGFVDDLIGINEQGGKEKARDNNNGAFLKAVLCDLLPERSSK